MELNKIQNAKLIKFDSNYQFFFVEDPKIPHNSPVSQYYMKLNDLSLNLRISLKWALWGYFFMKSITDSIEQLPNDFDPHTFMDNDKTFFCHHKENHIFLDNFDLDSFSTFKKLMENEYNSKLYSDNSSIHFKLKLNLNEYIVLQNNLFPYLFLME